jgi:hypothetical protein
VRRVPVAEMRRRYPEMAFRLDERADAVTEAFFASVRRFRAEAGPG